MKKTIGILLCALLAMSILAGCQKTPESPIVVGKSQNKMLEAAEPSGTLGQQDVSLAERYAIPERLTYATQSADGKLNISIDAAIYVPEVNQLPIARVVPAEFTQEQAMRYYKALCTDKGMLTPPSETTKSDIKTSIDYFQELLSNPESFAVSLYTEEERPQLEEELAGAYKRYAAAPEEAEWLPCDGTLREETFYHQGKLVYSYMGISAATKDWKYFFRVENNNDLKEAKEFLDEGSGWVASIRRRASILYSDNTAASNFEIDPECKRITDMSSVPEKARGKLSLTPEQAYDLAAAQLSGTDMIVRSLSLGMNTEEQKQYGAAPAYAYIATVIRNVHNVPCAGFSSSARPKSGEEPYAPDWFYENYTMMFDDRGIFSFDWSSPHEITEILKEDAQILPFDDIRGIAQKMLSIVYAAQDVNLLAHDISIDMVSLELQRIVEQNSIESGLMVPVWNFYGESIEEFDDSVGGSYTVRNYQAPLLSINAIDGSIINIEKGY